MFAACPKPWIALVSYMFGGFISFLGGSAFRMIWGEVSAWLTARQQHQQEIDRLKLQGQLDAEAHTRSLESLKLQSELGIKEIAAKAEAAEGQADLDAWVSAVKDVSKGTGIRWVDSWNGAIRPFLASMASAIVIAEFVRNGFTPTPWDLELVGAILGVYVADRSLVNRGK